MSAHRNAGAIPDPRLRLRSRLAAGVGAMLLATAFGGPLHAAEDPAASAPASDLKKLSLEELFDLEVTSVSQKPESLSQTAAAIHVVTQEDLRLRGTLSLPEALRNIPGVEVARVDARSYAVSARGFNGSIANKLLVLIDGRSVYTPLFSGVFWDVQDVFYEDVERIEVIRGPGATVWGANAVNGVINVISKDASQTQGLLLTGGAGDVERGFGGARFGGTFGSNAFFRVYGKSFDRDASVRADGSEADDDFRLTQGGFRVDWAPAGRDRLTLQGDAYGGSEQQPAPLEEAAVSGGNALARWTRELSATSDLQVLAYYDRTERDAPPTFSETLDTYDLELRHRFAPGAAHDLVWGLGYRQTRDDVTNSPGLAFLPARLNQDLFTFFVQDELTLVENRLRLTLGSKFEHNDYTGFEYQPSARLAWMPSANHTLWGALSRAVRAPSRIDRDLFIPATPPFFVTGGSDFESEELRALELGWKTELASHLTASLATFYNVYDNLRSGEAGPPVFLANGLEGRTLGAEAEAAYQVTPACRLNAGYTYLDQDLQTKPTSTDVTSERQEGDSPRHQVFVRSSLTLMRGVGVDLSVRHVGELPNQQVPAYTTGDATLTWRPDARVELLVAGRDLFDPRHAEFGMPPARREVRRSVYAKATCRF